MCEELLLVLRKLSCGVRSDFFGEAVGPMFAENIRGSHPLDKRGDEFVEPQERRGVSVFHSRSPVVVRTNTVARGEGGENPLPNRPTTPEAKAA